MFDVANWVACVNGENGPGWMPSHEALSVSPQGALEISSVIGQPPSVDRNHFSTPRLVAKSHKRDERLRPSSQRPQYPTLYRCLKRRLGHSLRANFCKRSVVRQGKKATYKCSGAEGSFSGPSKVQGPVSKPNSVSCHRQLNSGSLHKQTRWNPLGRDVRSPVEDHDLVPLLPGNTRSQTHSRVSECDGRPSVQVKPSSVNRMVTASGVQVFKQICLKWFTPHVDLFATRLNHKVPLYVSPVPDQNGWDIDALNINWSSLTAYAYPHMALLHRVIQKVRQSNRLIIVIAPENSVDFSTPSIKQVSDFFMYLYQDLNRRPSTIDGYRTAIVDTLGLTGLHISQTSDLNKLLSSFHRDRPKSSRNLPKWNLSVVLYELTKAPFEPMKDTDLKHLTPKTAFLLALASGQRHSEIHAWVTNKVSNLAQWEKVALFPSSDFIAKNHLAREGSQSVSPVTIPALTTIVGR